MSAPSLSAHCAWSFVSSGPHIKRTSDYCNKFSSEYKQRMSESACSYNALYRIISTVTKLCWATTYALPWRTGIGRKCRRRVTCARLDEL
jgi:hypothetical protein